MPQTMKLVPQRVPRSFTERLVESVRSYTVGPMSLKDPALMQFWGGGAKTAAGIYVTEAIAFTVAAVRNAIEQISSDVAKVALNLHKRRQDGGSELYTDSKLYRLLKDEPNPDMSSIVFRRTITAHALTRHGGYAEIERDGAGRPVALWVLTPDRVEPFLEKVTLPNGRYRSVLRYRIDGQTILDASDVLHIQGLGYDGYRAYSLIDQARQAIGLALAAERFGATFFGNGTTFGGVMSTEQMISEEAEKKLRANIEVYHASPDKAHRLLMLSGGWKYMQTGIPPNDAQMNELRDKQVEEVARFFNIPLHKLKVNKPGAVSYASVEMSDLDYYKGCLLTWFTLWEQELNRKLIPSLEYRRQYVKHNVNTFLRGDIKSRYDALGIARDKGIINADEWRELEDMNPQPNGQGQLYLVQSAQIPVDKLNELAQAQIDSKKQPPPQPAKSEPTDPNEVGRAIDALTERLDAADLAAHEARTEAQQAREQLVIAETAGTVTATELLQVREAAQQAGLLAVNLTTLSEQLRADLAIERQRVEAETAARTEAETRATAEATARTAAEALAVQAQLERDEAGQRAAEADRLAAEARSSADEAVSAAAAQVETAESARQAAELATNEAGTARLQAEALAAEADRRAAEATDVAHQVSARAAAASEGLALAEAQLEAASVAAIEAARELEQTRATVDQSVTERAALEAAAFEAREALEAATHARDLALAASVDLQVQLDATRLAREAAVEHETQARQLAVTAEAEQARTTATLEQAQSELETARADVERLTDELRTSREEHETRDRERLAEVQHLTEDRTAALDQVRTLEQSIAEAVADRDRQATELTHATTRHADLERMIEDARAQLTAITTVLTETRGTHEASTAALEMAMQALERDRDEALTERTERDAAVVVATTRIAELEEALTQRQRADDDATTATITAHRGLFVDIMRRMIERETDRLRRAQATPEKLHTAINAFYEGFEDLLRTALLPAVTIHLAFVRSQEDPHEAVRRFASSHVRESRRQLDAMLSDPDVYAGSITALWHRWETERTTTIADAIMQKELDYVRQR